MGVLGTALWVEDAGISCRSPCGLWPLPGAKCPQLWGCLGAAPLAHTTLVASSPPVRQYADICLFNTAQYKCPVAMEEAE